MLRAPPSPPCRVSFRTVLDSLEALHRGPRDTQPERGSTNRPAGGGHPGRSPPSFLIGRGRHTSGAHMDALQVVSSVWIAQLIRAADSCGAGSDLPPLPGPRRLSDSAAAAPPGLRTSRLSRVTLVTSLAFTHTAVVGRFVILRKGGSMRRILFAVAALVIPASAVTLGLSSTAWAGGGTSCSALTGNASGGSGSITGCTDLANTGGSGTFPISAFTSGSGTITWATGGTTSVTVVATIPKKDERDPHGSCAAGSTEFSVKGKITGSTGSGSSVKGKIKGEVCLDGSGNLTLEPGTVLKF